MIDLYTWSTPNGRKVSIMLEEIGLPYRVHPVNIGAGEQHTPEFLAINPNNRIPAIIDQDGPEGRPFKLFESGAILLYLSWKTGKFLPVRATDQFEVIQWLMFQMGGVGPMFGQVHHFVRAAPEPVPYAIARYTTETRRLYGVLNGHLQGARVSGIGILRRRHGHLPLGGAARVAQGGPERLSRGEALVRPARERGPRSSAGCWSRRSRSDGQSMRGNGVF